MDLDKLLPGLALALISALTFVAYKHPNGYARLLWPIRIIIPALFFGFVIWDNATSRAYIRLMGLIEPSKLEAAKITTENAQYISGYITLGYIAVLAYLEFLIFLPDLLDLRKEDPPTEKS